MERQTYGDKKSAAPWPRCSGNFMRKIKMLKLFREIAPLLSGLGLESLPTAPPDAARHTSRRPATCELHPTQGVQLFFIKLRPEERSLVCYKFATTELVCKSVVRSIYRNTVVAVVLNIDSALQ